MKFNIDLGNNDKAIVFDEGYDVKDAINHVIYGPVTFDPPSSLEINHKDEIVKVREV